MTCPDVLHIYLVKQVLYEEVLQCCVFFSSGVPDGVEMAILLALSRRLNFTWQLIDLRYADLWGHRDANGTWSGGIVGSMSQKLADIAFCGIYIEERVMQEMDLTIPWTHYCLTFLVPRRAHSFRFAFLKTFQPLLWLLITVVTVGTAAVLWLLSRFEQSKYNCASCSARSNLFDFSFLLRRQAELLTVLTHHFSPLYPLYIICINSVSPLL
jgi:hypothetical protein